MTFNIKTKSKYLILQSLQIKKETHVKYCDYMNVCTLYCTDKLEFFNKKSPLGILEPRELSCDTQNIKIKTRL
jgi:hypothetical protein